MNALILIVENERELARGLQFALEGEGYRVTLAWDAEAALGLLEQERPDLILADLRLPGMDGYALLRLVKQDDRWRDVPFVFVTAAADWRNAVQAKAMGADEYIVKPFDLDDFIAIVNRLAGVRAEAELPGDLNGGDAQD